MKIEFVLIAIIAMAASLSAYAEEMTEGATEGVTVQSGYQGGLCTEAQRKI